jgi:recombinational DNA repair protein RecR
MNGAIQYFVLQDNLSSISHLDIKDILKRYAKPHLNANKFPRFKENILFLKPLVEEDVTIRAGLDKTCETINTFVNILK